MLSASGFEGSEEEGAKKICMEKTTYDVVGLVGIDLMKTNVYQYTTGKRQLQDLTKSRFVTFELLVPLVKQRMDNRGSSTTTVD